MLTKKDKDWIRKIIQEEFKEALLCSVTVDKGVRKPGDIERHYETEEVNILHFLAKYLPFIEGAVRGMQEDTNKTNNSIIGLPEKLELIAKILTDNENITMKLAQFIHMLEENNILLTNNKTQLIEHEGDT